MYTKTCSDEAVAVGLNGGADMRVRIKMLDSCGPDVRVCRSNQASSTAAITEEKCIEYGSYLRLFVRWHMIFW